MSLNYESVHRLGEVYGARRWSSFDLASHGEDALVAREADIGRGLPVLAMAAVICGDRARQPGCGSFRDTVIAKPTLQVTIYSARSRRARWRPLGKPVTLQGHLQMRREFWIPNSIWDPLLFILDPWYIARHVETAGEE
jgi:hypothetical protein